MKLMYINGEFTQGTAKEEIEVTNPATEEVLDTVPRGSTEDVEAAVRSSKEAFTTWRKWVQTSGQVCCMKLHPKFGATERKLFIY